MSLRWGLVAMRRTIIFQWLTIAVMGSCLSACGGASGPVDTTLPENEANLASAAPACSQSETSIDIGSTISGGTVELLAPLMDTDGMASKVYLAKPVTCIPIADLQALRNGAGLKVSDPLPLQIGYDPAGEPSNFRSQLSYMALLAEELATTPKPPSEMRFGNASWTDGGAINIQWHADFRKYLESSLGDVEPSPTASSTPNEQRNAGSWTVKESSLISQWHEANSKCRGGSGDDEATIAACDERDGALKDRLRDANICYGREGEAGYQMVMHRCGATSLRSE